MENAYSWKRSMRDACISALLLFGSFSAIGFPVLYKQEKLRSNLYNQAAILADANKDGVTTQEEWERVYSKAGLLQPNKLSIQNLEKIIKYSQ